MERLERLQRRLYQERSARASISCKKIGNGGRYVPVFYPFLVEGHDVGSGFFGRRALAAGRVDGGEPHVPWLVHE
jgi:hypothetical protein